MTIKNLLKSTYYKIKNSFPYRNYFDKYSCIFIHIPKTAGTSILECLAENEKIHRDHCGWDEYKKYNPIKFREYYKFAVVRNPYDRIMSVYSYWKNGGNQKEGVYFKELFEKENINFEKFILEYLDEYKIHEHLLLKPQYLFVYDHKDTLKVDKLIKYENLHKEFKEIRNMLEIKHDLKKTNQSNSSKYLKDLESNQKVKGKIQLLYKKDFELLNYEK